jgi:nucleotide-binding universal stress UspA family protein
MSDKTLNMKTIVVCIDFTAASDLALLYARRFAVRSGAKLLLVHIVDPARVSPEELDAHLALHDIVDSAKADMQKIWTELAGQGITGSWIVRRGNVRDMILDAVQENQADLMVLGSKGMSLTGGSRFGTVAEQLVRAAPCPVLTVVPESPWQQLENDHHRCLLVPTDFSAASQAAFLYALAFAKSIGGSLLLLHAIEDDFAVEPIAGQLEDLRAKEMRMLLASAREAHVEAESMIRAGDASELILELARERKADYIVMGVRAGDQVDGTRLHGRVQGLMHQSPCPLFSIYLRKSTTTSSRKRETRESLSLSEPSR